MIDSPFYRTSYERHLVIVDIKPIICRIDRSLILPEYLKSKNKYSLLEVIMTNSECNQEEGLLDIGVDLIAESVYQESILDEIVSLLHLKELLLTQFLSSVGASNLIEDTAVSFGYSFYRMQNLLANRYASLLFDVNELFVKERIT